MGALCPSCRVQETPHAGLCDRVVVVDVTVVDGRNQGVLRPSHETWELHCDCRGCPPRFDPIVATTTDGALVRVIPTYDPRAIATPSR